MTDYQNQAIGKAMKSLANVILKAETDTARPLFHFRAPGGWMNDPNGTILFDGYYHVFYQHNPYADYWDTIHWGHARSRDLVRWEHRPIAIWPSNEKGETDCWSGCCHLNVDGTPTIIYTSISHRKRFVDHTQWAAVSRDGMETWEKYEQNPVIAIQPGVAPCIKGDWRDPFVFVEQGRTFLILGAEREDKEELVILLYEAEDGSLLRWLYRGILFSKAKETNLFFECPNMVKIGDKWILITSPYRPVEYYIGHFDATSLSFTPEKGGRLDHSTALYATNVIYDSRGRCILFAWVRGFPKGRGWNGCLALPRILSMSESMELLQTPVPELQMLRGYQDELLGVTVTSGQPLLRDIATGCFEIHISLLFRSTAEVTFRLRNHSDKSRCTGIHYDGRMLTIAETSFPYELLKQRNQLSLDIFVDRSVIEVFVDNGRQTVTSIVDFLEDGATLEITTMVGELLVETLNIWNLASIW